MPKASPSSPSTETQHEIEPPNEIPPAITADDLSKTYRSGTVFRKHFDALKGVTFRVKRGEVFGLLGPNGAGKTTFVKILLGIIRKSGGTASMMGYPAGSIAARRHAGYLPEHLRISPHLTAFTALECYGNLSNVPTSTIREKRESLLDLVGLAGREKEPIRNFSKGMLQRLGLAQAMLHEPQLLMLDEPTDGLDPRARAEMRQIIHKLRESGVTIFLNSHLLQEVELICDSVAILDHGTLRYCGDIGAIGDAVSGGTAGKARLQAELDLIGPVSQLEEVAGSQTISHVKPPSEKLATITVDFEDQQAVDQLVDSLRNGGFSIVRLTPRRLSLEDAFLKLIDDLKK